MKLKRIVALLLTLTIAMGTVTPALAAERAVPGPVVTPALVLPAGTELSDEELAEVRGEALQWLLGAASGAVSFILSTADEEKDLEWGVRLFTATAIGALTGGISAGLIGAATTTAGQFAAGAATIAAGAYMEHAVGSGYPD